MKMIMKFIIFSFILSFSNAYAFIFITNVSQNVADEINVTILFFKNINQKIMDISSVLEPDRRYYDLVEKYPNDFKNLIGRHYLIVRDSLERELSHYFETLFRIDTELKKEELVFNGIITKSQPQPIYREVCANSIIYVVVSSKNKDILRETIIFPISGIDNKIDTKYWSFNFFNKERDLFRSGQGVSNFYYEKGNPLDVIPLYLQIGDQQTYFRFC